MKTRDAFALREVVDELANINFMPEHGFDGHGGLPTYAGRFDTSEEGQLNYFNSSDGQMEEILLGYLMRGETKLESDDSLSEFERQYSKLKRDRKRINRAKDIVDWISKHVVHLQKYEKKIWDSILETGLSVELKRKGNRVKQIIADYNWLIELFAGYEAILQKDRESLRLVVNQLYRKEFGGRLRQARIAKNMTTEEVAGKINLTRIGYGYYELGQRDPTPATIYILAQMFDVSADWLLGLTKK